MRTVMYEIKKELNMNVSLRRKIHIMALPQGTFLNARWSEDQSATTPCNPPDIGSDSAELVIAGWVMFFDPLRYPAAQVSGMHPAAPASARQTNS
jgi:hypothetical protein